MGRRDRALLSVALIVVACASLAPSAGARNLYASDATGSVLTYDLASNQLVGSPALIGPGTSPGTLAVTPDGRAIVTVARETTDVSLIDVATNTAGPPIPVGGAPQGVGVTPDGNRAYVANNGDSSVSVIDLRSSQPIGDPIPVGGEPMGIAVSPDGKRVYVANHISESVSVIDTASNKTLGPEIMVGGGPNGLAITPDGKLLFVSDGFGYVYVIETATDTVLAPIVIGPGNETTDIAIGPNGKRAYAANFQTGTISVIDIATLQVVGTPIPVGQFIAPLEVTPDGKRLLVLRYGTPDEIISIDTATDEVSGSPITHEDLVEMVVAPDQPPAASFAPRGRVRPGVPATLDASTSADPDGTVANFAWSFGDGTTASSSSAEQSHLYAGPGAYQATLTLTDDEGCSTAFVFTGQTASCNGSQVATQTKTIEVAYPGVRVRCPKKAKGGCRFKLRAVFRKKGRLKPQSAVARAKAKAGRSVVVSLRPKPAFAAKLAGAEKALVRVKLKIGGKTTIRVKKLKIVQ